MSRRNASPLFSLPQFTTRTMRYADLFCGMGSFTHSFHRLGGFECVFACDSSAAARTVFEANHGVRPEGKIEAVDAASVPDHDVLCAGFPCQPFSFAGAKEGFADARGTLFFHIVRILREKKPSFVILENVPALLHHDGGRTFASILSHLGEAGYGTEHAVATSSDYGCPQGRKRLFVVGRRADLPPLPSPVLDFSSYESRTTLSDLLGLAFERDFAYTIRCGGKRSGLGDRHNWDTYRLAGGEVHTLTVREALLLQGFGEEYAFPGISETTKWHLLGNTIPTVFTRMIGERIRSSAAAP